MINYTKLLGRLLVPTFLVLVAQQQNSFRLSIPTQTIGQGESNTTRSARATESLKHGVMFAPGSLNLSQLETYRKCYVDPCKYHHHTGPFLTCAISEAHNLTYFLIPKSGSSTVRITMKKDFQATEKRCIASDFRGQSHDYHRFSFVREPYSSFLAGYHQAVKNMLMAKAQGKRQPPSHIPFKYLSSFYEPFESISGVGKVFREGGEQVLGDALQKFVRDYSGDIPFDPHLNLQITRFASRITGRVRPLDYVGDTNTIDATVQALAEKAQVQQQLEPKHANQRKWSIDGNNLSIEERQKICQVLAIDYCCLNYELPQECQGLVQCRWTVRPEYPNEALIEAVSPYPPADSCQRTKND